jgi:hypothetical protein
MAKKQADTAQRKAYIEQYASKEVISRTIEDFTLGMDIEQAMSILSSGIKNRKFKIVDLALQNSLPMLSDSKIMSKGVELPIPAKISKVFSTPTSKGVQLIFYQSKLYEIGIASLAEHKTVEDSIMKKYGTPTDQLQGPFGKAADIWKDKSTILDLRKEGLLTGTRTYITNRVGESIELRIFYKDRQIDELLETQASNILREQEKEEQRKRKALPKGY